MEGIVRSILVAGSEGIRSLAISDNGWLIVETASVSHAIPPSEIWSAVVEGPKTVPEQVPQPAMIQAQGYPGKKRKG
jgi:hypothetical protein